MAQPRIDDDIKFLIGEIKLGLNFLRDYFKDKSEDDAKKRKFAIIEYGPFNGLKLLGVIILLLWFFITFSLWRFETTLWVTLFLGIFLYDIIFQKGWITPFFVGVGTVLFTWGKDFIIWFYGFSIATLTDLAMWIWGVTKDLLLYLYEIAKEIVVGVVGIALDILGFAKDSAISLTTAIVGGIAEFAKDIVSGVFTTIGEIIGIGAKPASKE